MGIRSIKSAKEFIALKDLKDECWSQYTDQLALAMEEYAKQKAWEAWKHRAELSTVTKMSEAFKEWWEENNK